MKEIIINIYPHFSIKVEKIRSYGQELCEKKHHFTILEQNLKIDNEFHPVRKYKTAAGVKNYLSKYYNQDVDIVKIQNLKTLIIDNNFNASYE